MSMRTKMPSKFLSLVADYYSDKLAKYGLTPQGVDWNGKKSQELRFEQLCKIINSAKGFSVNDLGCGYGAMFEFLDERYSEFTFNGFDISENMIKASSQRFKTRNNAHFSVGDCPSEIADYSIASGIFNVKLQQNDMEWLQYIYQTLNVLNEYSRLGFSFNCLTSYSDKDKMRDYLYYADPCVVFDHCKRNFSRNVALVHDYELFEFTIIVRKQK